MITITMKNTLSRLLKTESFRKIKTIHTAMLFALLCISFTGFGQTPASAFDMIYGQMKQKNFFEARTSFAAHKKKLPVEYQYFTEAVLDNAFNKPQESNLKIAKLEMLKPSFPDSLMLKIGRIKEDNCMKQYDYAGAKKAVQGTLQQYDRLLTQDEKDDLKNNLKIWTALENEPRQKIVMNGSTRLKMEKDAAGLKNLKVDIGEGTMNFIFDTGANISTISTSAAQRLHMKIIPAAIDVDAITGISVKADLAVCKKLVLGNITVENAVFLVFADSALSFPQIKYQINGILGFPVIEALKEVQLTKDDYFIVPDTETKINTVSNLAIDGLSPLIFIDGKHFSFDTGADHTILYAPFYQENKKNIDRQYQVTKISMGGAGGKIEYDGFKINHTFHILDKKIPLENVSVLTTKINKETVYGNIGQDVIRQFNTMTMNFDQMFIKFD
ncbi:putative aspartyl protease [Chryseobacterium rhizosphaerae]|jgi:predicted aspartyl protease|uniref:pepsin/retropepsin-like aspartic protease family protein n=1 Tax=Chryseobacterium rhizosphaerae TaxID=395937 RepID=UPI00285F1AB5|nr:pepsin/retropepsin-like aspartic protease family protein [Chryseobacterium rhizosphaerae]MDR6548363.1 putative aspartyl protease [Chryseobacterium rhizosphaerae]